MAQTFFFYDLETSGFNPRQARIMQFAGQRTDLDLNPVGEPVNFLIKMTPDVLPDPDAVMLTGITPQKTIADGLTETEFLKTFQQDIVQPDTIFCGFNSIRFDDEFMRFMLYRNFYDSYEWQWQDGCSRWDILDMVRMTRAIKPEGIKWPFAPDGKPANRLEYLTKVNNLTHTSAHDALSDVDATIDVARLIKFNQPKLFSFLLEHRSKDGVRSIVESGKPFMYTSGRFSSEFLHTSPVVLLGKKDRRDEALVYDLRVDPQPFLDMNIDQIIESWKYNPDPDAQRLPVKTIKYNRSPAVLPGIVSDQPTLDRLKIDRAQIAKNLKIISLEGKKFVKMLFEARDKMDEARDKAQTEIIDDQLSVDARLYDGFLDNQDKTLMSAVRAASPNELSGLIDGFKDRRLKSLLPLYKARNFSKQLTTEEAKAWEDFRTRKLLSGGDDSQLGIFMKRLEEIAATGPKGEKAYLLEELKLYAESILPTDVA